MNNRLFQPLNFCGLFFIVLTLSISVFSQDEIECVNSNRNYDYLVKQYNNALKTSPISKAIIDTFPVFNKPKTEIMNIGNAHDVEATAPVDCTTCGISVLKFPTDDIESMRNFIAEKSKIKLVCAIAARKFSAATEELQCPEGKEVKAPTEYRMEGKRRIVVEPNGACVTKNMLDYKTIVYENFYRCARRHSSAPFNMATIFEIVSRESTFKPNFSSRAGHGSGQVTAIFAKDAQTRGRAFLKKIANDKSPACAAASLLAKSDVDKNFVIPRDRCDFIQYGSGMERNALFMMTGLNTFWERSINPLFASYMKKHKQHPDLPKVLAKMLQVSYGRAGVGGAISLHTKLSSLPPDQFLKRLDSAMPTTNDVDSSNGLATDFTAYLREISSRQKHIGEKLDKLLGAEEDDNKLRDNYKKNGANACLE